MRNNDQMTPLTKNTVESIQSALSPLDADGLRPTRRAVAHFGLLASVLATPAWAQAGNSQLGDPTVLTRNGPVQGVRADDVLVFRGIRYGADTRTTRFAKPEAPAPWRDVVRTQEFGAASPQPGSEPNQSEDCLFLNVWTPSLSARANRPVMVYIHGGAYNTGSGTSPLTNGARLALEEDVVVVTINHRLNAFGYLYLEGVAPGFRPDGGNAGQWDLILALKWIRDNIANFGGNPSRVLMFGQSGGGAKIATLMATPAAQGLFHSVATMSGQQVTASGPLNASKRGVAYLQALGISPSSPTDILTISHQKLIDALGTADPVNSEQKIYFGPVVDQRMLVQHPFWPQAPALSRAIPMILGNVKDETRNLIGRGSPEAFALTFDTLPTWLSKHMRTDIAPTRVIETYRATYPNISASDLFFAATTAARSWRGQVEEADARARQGAPTWVYRLDLGSPDDGGKWGAFHTLDIPHAFRTLTAEGSMTGNAPAAQRVSGQLSKALVNLARTGAPHHGDLRSWPRYSLARRETLLLDAQTRVANDPRGIERALFATAPFIQWGT